MALDYSQTIYYDDYMHKIFEYRLRPNRKQQKVLEDILESTRLMYNQCLEELIAHYKKTGKHLNRFAHDRLHGTKEHPDIPAVIVDQIIARIQRSFENFFRGRKSGKKIGFPRFKSSNQWHSFEFRDAQQHMDGRYFGATKRIGKIRAVVHRPLDGKFKFARIIKRPSGWYLQCICEVDPGLLPQTGNAVGLDMGIKSLVADSNGNTIANPHHLRSELKSLAHSQRLLSRKQKGSHRRKKQAKIVARRHERITNRRKDFAHKVAGKYVNENDLIAVEDLNVAGMVQNRHLSRAISDASWGLLRQLLAYKAESAGRRFVAVSPRFTSQKCSMCGEYVEKSLSVRTHICQNCGYMDDRDVNAAKNILKIGLDEAIVEGFQWATQ